MYGYGRIKNAYFRWEIGKIILVLLTICGKTDWGNKFNNTPARVGMYAVRDILRIDYQKYLKF